MLDLVRFELWLVPLIHILNRLLLSTGERPTSNASPPRLLDLCCIEIRHYPRLILYHLVGHRYRRLRTT